MDGFNMGATPEERRSTLRDVLLGRRIPRQTDLMLRSKPSPTIPGFRRYEGEGYRRDRPGVTAYIVPETVDERFLHDRVQKMTVGNPGGMGGVDLDLRDAWRRQTNDRERQIRQMYRNLNDF